MIRLTPLASISRRAAAFALLVAAPAAAQPVEDLAALDARVAAFAGAGVGETGGPSAPIDRRLRLAACATPATVDWFGTRRSAVVIACPGGWKVYVPVRGATVSASTTNAAASALAPKAVHRGDPVKISAGGRGYRVSVDGVADQDGAVGASIRVRNLASGVAQRAIVEGPGNVLLAN